MKRWFALGFIILLGCSQEGEPHEHSRPSFPVRTAKVVERSVPNCCQVMGHTAAYMDVAITPHVEGRLLTNHASDGKMVKKGELLYEIDPAPYRAKFNKAQAILEKSRASLHLAEKKVERYADLLEKEFISKLYFDELKTDLDLAKAEVFLNEASLELAQIDLDYCQIHSPIDGKMSANGYDVGNWVTPGDAQPLTIVRKLDPALVRFHLPQETYQLLPRDVDFVVEVTLPNAKPGSQPLQGQVYFLDNAFDPSTGTLFMKAVVPNPENILWPGEFVQVRLIIKTDPHALLIPKTAIVTGQKGPFVFLVNGDYTVTQRQISLGSEHGEEIVVHKGLEKGDEVVVEGQIRLREGALVAHQERVSRS